MTNERVRESMTPAPTTVEASEDVVEARVGWRPRTSVRCQSSPTASWSEW